MLKIIFLDIDGVLNSVKYYKSKEYKEYVNNVNTHKKLYAREKLIDKKAIKILNNIIEETDAKVVVSSTWRKSGIDCVREELRISGFIGEIIDVTPILSFKGSVRGNEILLWLKENEDLYGDNYYSYINYLILDDDSDMLLWQKDNFIKIDCKIGLLKKHVNKCIKILNNIREY